MTQGPSDRDLLVAAVAGASEHAGSAWAELLWRHQDEQHALLTWINAGGERRLLPLLALRSEELALDGVLGEACLSATAEAWALNERAFAGLVPFLNECADRGVTPVALKGLALLGDVYPRHAERPIGDADLLVSGDEIGAVLAAMQRIGWSAPRRIDSLGRAARHALTVAVPGGGFLDLHWRPGGIDPYRGSPRRWVHHGAEPVDAQHPLVGTGLRRPSAERHLLLIAAHGARRGNEHIAHWMVDVARILSSMPVDGELLVASASEVPFAVRAAEGLRRCSVVLGCELPVDPARLTSGSSRLARQERLIMRSEARPVRARSWRARRALVWRTAGGSPLGSLFVGAGLAREWVGRRRRR